MRGSRRPILTQLLSLLRWLTDRLPSSTVSWSPCKNLIELNRNFSLPLWITAGESLVQLVSTVLTSDLGTRLRDYRWIDMKLELDSNQIQIGTWILIKKLNQKHEFRIRNLADCSLGNFGILNSNRWSMRMIQMEMTRMKTIQIERRFECLMPSRAGRAPRVRIAATCQKVLIKTF